MRQDFAWMFATQSRLILNGVLLAVGVIKIFCDVKLAGIRKVKSFPPSSK